MKAVWPILLMSLGCYGSQQSYDQLCKKNYNGFLRHPEDCHKFIRCSHRRAYVFHCPSDLLWHHEIESCDYSYHTLCKVKEFQNGDRKSEATTLWENFEVYKEKSESKTSKKPENLSTINVNVAEAYLQSNVKNFTEHKLIQSVKRNFTAKFYYVKKIIKDHTVAAIQNSIENYNSTLLEELAVSTDAVKLTDAKLIGFTESTIEITKYSDDYSNLKESNPQKENKTVVSAANCSKNKNKIKNTKEIVAVTVTESIFTDFPKGATEISKNLNSSTANYNSTMLEELKNSSNNLNLREFEAVKVTEEDYLTTILTNSLQSVNSTENSTVNNITVLEKKKSPVKCSCLRAPQLKVVTADATAITESSVNVSESTERVINKTTKEENGQIIETLEKPFKAEDLTENKERIETEKKTNDVSTENSLYIKSSIGSTTTTYLEQEVSSINSITLKDPYAVKITDKDSVITTLTTDISNNLINLPITESDNLIVKITDFENKPTTFNVESLVDTVKSSTETNNKNISTDFAIKTSITNNAVNLTEVMVTSFPEGFKLTQIFRNKTKESNSKINDTVKNSDKINFLNITPTTAAMLTEVSSTFTTDFESNDKEVPTTAITTIESSNSNNNSKKPTDFAVTKAINLTEIKSIDFTESWYLTTKIPDKTKDHEYINDSKDYNTTSSILTEDATAVITKLETEKTTLTTFSDNSLNSIENDENFTVAVKDSHQNDSSDNIYLLESMLTAELINNDILTEQLTVKPNVKLTENVANISLYNNSDILNYSNLTVNFPVKVTVKPNINLTTNEENPFNTFNLTENFHKINNSLIILIDSSSTDNIPTYSFNLTENSHTINNSDIKIDSYVTDNIPVKVTVQPNVNLTVNVENTTNTFNSNTVNGIITELTNDFINIYNLTEKSTDVIDTTAKLTENVIKLKNSTVNSLDKIENSIEYVTESFIETNNIDMVTKFAVNLTDATINALNLTENSFSVTETFTESFTLLQTENNNSNYLTDLAVNITDESNTVPSNTEVMLTKSTKELLNSLNLTKSSTASPIESTVNLTATTWDSINQNHSNNFSNNSFDFNKFNTISYLTESSLQNIPNNRIIELFTEFMSTESTKDVLKSFNSTEKFTEPTETNISTDFTVNLTHQATVDKTTTVSSYNLTENYLQNLPKDRITDLPLIVNVTTEKSRNSFYLENVTEPSEDLSVKITFNTNRTNTKPSKNSVNVTDNVLTVDSVTDDTYNSVNIDNSTEPLFKEVSVKPNDEGKENVTATKTSKENDENSVKIENVSEVMFTEETVKISDENSVNIKELIETMITEGTVKTTDKDNINLNSFSTESIKKNDENSVKMENVTEAMFTEESEEIEENSVNIKELIEIMITEGTVKTTNKDGNILNTFSTETIKENDENSVKNENVTVAMFTEESVNISELIETEGAVKTTDEDDNNFNKFSIVTTPLSKEYKAATETVEHSVNIENVTEYMLKDGTVNEKDDDVNNDLTYSIMKITSDTNKNISATETVNKTPENSVKAEHTTESMITEGTVKTTEKNIVGMDFSIQTTPFAKEKITSTETIKKNIENITETILRDETVKITENNDNISKQFTTETKPIIKDNIAATASVKENVKNSVNVENIADSTITEITVAITEYVTNILNHYPNKTTVVIKENLNTMKPDILEENTTEISQKNVTNIMLTTNLTESPEIGNNSKAINTQYPSTISPVYTTTEILKYTQAERESTTLSPPSTSPELYIVDITTLDPRLPFRSIECVGSNNRRQFQSSECYQYYQCFAGWAFLLNCHEGWRFEATEGQCILDVNNECEM